MSQLNWIERPHNEWRAQAFGFTYTLFMCDVDYCQARIECENFIVFHTDLDNVEHGKEECQFHHDGICTAINQATEKMRSQ